MLGDPTDTRTLFDQQMRFADGVRAQGHHARTVEVVGLGDLMHGVTHLAFIVGMAIHG